MPTSRESAGRIGHASVARTGAWASRDACPKSTNMLRTTPQCIAAPSPTGAVLAPTWQSPFVPTVARAFVSEHEAHQVQLEIS
jgi:hypothetical protein